VLDGSATVLDGSATVLDGSATVLDGSATVLDGSATVLDGSATVLDGSDTVLDGSATEVISVLKAVAAERGSVVWLVNPADDPAISAGLAEFASRTSKDADIELEVLHGSWDPPGARLLDVVSVMDRLRSPGGCPWVSEQTNDSLVPYLLEEAYETHDALANNDLEELREELGDLLLQVAFHARIAEELPEDERWSIDDVAGGLVDKLIRRHPHVFAVTELAGDEITGTAGTGTAGNGVERGGPLGIAEVGENWERIKRAEKQRDSSLDGVALSQPALALAAQFFRRAARAGIQLSPANALSPADAVPEAMHAMPEALDPASMEELGETLLAMVARAQVRGLDAEAALRAAALRFAAAVRSAEHASRLT
jgi:XTP/dITP diphosphohydrolase